MCCLLRSLFTHVLTQLSKALQILQRKFLKTPSNQEEKKNKIGVYNNNFLLGYNYNTISSINFNDPSIKRIIDNNCVNGVSISLIIEDILQLIYNTYENELKSQELIKVIKSELAKLNRNESDSWKNFK